MTLDQVTTDVHSGFAFDVDRLERYMRRHVEDFRGPLGVRQYPGGQSNPTYLLSTPDQHYVLRRKPPGQLLPSAHAIDREYRVMQALRSHSGVPVPRTYALCTDETVIGTWFFIMEHVAGRIFWDASFPGISRGDRPRYFDVMNATLARLHTTNYAAIGLADFGKPGSYFERQIVRWSNQYLKDKAAGQVSAMDSLIEWLPSRTPPGDEASIVHGDFRCDNMIFHSSQPRVMAVLDWELSTLGHPLADFGNHLMMYRMPPLGISGLKGRDLEALNIPSEEQYVAAYCARTARARLPHLDFYVAFSMFRMAAIFHGIRGRMMRGTAVSARAKEYAAAVEQMADLAWAQAVKAEGGSA